MWHPWALNYCFIFFFRAVEKDLKNNGSRYYTLDQLLPNSAYTVCFDTILHSSDAAEQGFDDATSPRSKKSLGDDADEGDGTTSSTCEEIVTLDVPDAAWANSFPVTEVATASVVSTSTTVAIVLLVCCCCFPRFELLTDQKRPINLKAMYSKFCFSDAAEAVEMRTEKSTLPAINTDIRTRKPVPKGKRRT